MLCPLCRGTKHKINSPECGGGKDDVDGGWAECCSCGSDIADDLLLGTRFRFRIGDGHVTSRYQFDCYYRHLDNKHPINGWASSVGDLLAHGWRRFDTSAIGEPQWICDYCLSPRKQAERKAIRKVAVVVAVRSTAHIAMVLSIDCSAARGPRSRSNANVPSTANTTTARSTVCAPTPSASIPSRAFEALPLRTHSTCPTITAGELAPAARRSRFPRAKTSPPASVAAQCGSDTDCRRGSLLCYTLYGPCVRLSRCEAGESRPPPRAGCLGDDSWRGGAKSSVASPLSGVSPRKAIATPVGQWASRVRNTFAVPAIMRIACAR